MYGGVLVFLTELCYSHTKKEGTKAAYSLARYTLQILDLSVWMENVPPQCLFVFQADLAGIS